MSEPTWTEIVMAGKLFAILTSDANIFKTESVLENIAIDHGIIRLELSDGQKFELTVRQLK